MLDATIRPIIDMPLNLAGRKIADFGISANVMTLTGFSFGVLAMVAIMAQHPLLAAILIGCNRLADGLDGAIARKNGLTDFGGFMDILSDFIIYSGVVFSFGVADSSKLPYANFLIFSFVGTITSFLAYAIIASKHQLITEKRGKKSFYYLGGLCEGTETALVLLLFCVQPQWFNITSLIFGTLCWLTTVGRAHRAWNDFR